VRVVPKPEMNPARCAVLPQLSEDREGFVDTGNTLPFIEPRIYVSATACRMLGAQFGMVTGEEHAELQDELAAAQGELEVARAELAETAAFVDSIHVIESAGFRPRKKPGPKKQPQAA
jgi:hypothetical protein